MSTAIDEIFWLDEAIEPNEREVVKMSECKSETYALYIENDHDESHESYGLTKAHKVICWATFSDDSRSGMVDLGDDILIEAETIDFFSGYETVDE